MIINQNFQISNIILVYEIIFLILYYFFKINKRFLSWPIFINIFIILVVIFCDCNLKLYMIVIILFLKVFFLFILLNIVSFSLEDYFIGILVLIIYYKYSNINKIYKCKIKITCLIISFIIASLIYLYKLFLIKSTKFLGS